MRQCRPGSLLPRPGWLALIAVPTASADRPRSGGRPAAARVRTNNGSRMRTNSGTFSAMSASGNAKPILSVRFFSTTTGNEPVREWLVGLDREVRRAVGFDIKTAQFGWPIGVPLIRKLEPGLWEVRSHVATGIARVLFTVEGDTMVLLHRFIKKSQKTLAPDLETAKQRLAELNKR